MAAKLDRVRRVRAREPGRGNQDPLASQGASPSVPLLLGEPETWLMGPKHLWAAPYAGNRLVPSGFSELGHAHSGIQSEYKPRLQASRGCSFGGAKEIVFISFFCKCCFRCVTEFCSWFHLLLPCPRQTPTHSDAFLSAPLAETLHYLAPSCGSRVWAEREGARTYNLL